MIGDKIKAARLAKDFTQEELANKLGISRYAILKYEKGLVKEIPPDKLQRLVDVLDLDAAALLKMPQGYFIRVDDYTPENYAVLVHLAKELKKEK